MSPDQARWLQGRPFIFKPNTAPLFSSIIHESPPPACLIPLASWSSPPPTLYRTWTSLKSRYSLDIRGIGCGIMLEGEGEKKRCSRVYWAPIWGFRLMNHPERREQKRNDPDSFIFVCFLFFLFLSLATAAKQFLQVAHTSTFKHPSALKKLLLAFLQTMSTADLPLTARFLY